jgi:16S rRNA (uracil1498-N3)-methyltransferase
MSRIIHYFRGTKPMEIDINMPVFYSNQIRDNLAQLDEQESRHCILVLRLKKGDHVHLVDGAGHLYKGIVEIPDPRACRILIHEIKRNHLARDYYLHLAIAPTKSINRFEWFVEKATEIGVDEITPLICERSERREIRTDRFRKILLAAMKQSGRATLPRLNPPVDFKTFIRYSGKGRRLIAHCRVAAERYAGALGTDIRDWLILIGPEGDFSEAEISSAREEKFLEISLGDAVYRTETAGIIACQIIAGLYRKPESS